MILPCDCKHEFQDSLYGKGRRVKNFAKKANGYRCTVCGKLDTSVKKEEKKIEKREDKENVK